MPRKTHPPPVCVSFALTPSHRQHPDARRDISWEPYNLAQFRHYLPGDTSDLASSGLTPTWLPPFQTPIPSAGCPSGFSPTGYTSEVLTTPFLGTISLLQQLIELRKTVLLTVYWLILIGYDKGYSRTSRWDRCIGQGRWEGHRASCPPRAHHPPSTTTCSPTWKFPKPGNFGILWRFRHVAVIDH